jgi:prephenate dehydrogenase
MLWLCLGVMSVSFIGGGLIGGLLATIISAPACGSCRFAREAYERPARKSDAA